MLNPFHPMKIPITLYVSSNAPRAAGNDEVTIYATRGNSRDEHLFEFSVSRRHLARALAIDAAPFYSVGAQMVELNPMPVEQEAEEDEPGEQIRI